MQDTFPEPATARHCLARVRRPERVSAQAEGRAARTVALQSARACLGGAERACRGQAGAGGFVFAKSAK